MLEKGRISSIQMALLLHPTIVATAVLLVPAMTEKHAGRDMWLSPLWASFSGFAVVLTAWLLNRMYPNDTLIEHSVRILGKIPGKALGMLYIFFYWHATGLLIKEYGEFVTGTFLLHTPIQVIMGSMLVICAFAVRGGIEVLGRCAQIMVPVVVLLYILIIFLLIPDLNSDNLFPMLEHGWMPSLKGSIIPQSWYSELIAISFLLPVLADRDKALRWGIISVLFIAFTLFLTNITTLMLFGQLTGRLVYPVMAAARYIQLADFLEHLEAIVMAIWVFGTFIKISMFYYMLVQSTARVLGLSDYRPIVLPLGLLVLLSGIWAASNLQELVHVLSTSIVFELLFMQLGIPVLLLLIAIFRRKKGRNKAVG